MRTVFTPILFAALFLVCQSSHAAVLEFTVKPLWETAAGGFTTIDFTGFAGSTFITDQYAGEGLLFTDGNDAIRNSGTKSFPNDGSGLAGSDSSSDPDGDINVFFTSSMFQIGIDYPGAMRIELYRNSQLIYTSSDFGGSGAGFFAGLISTEPFDAAVLLDWDDNRVFIDDLHFGIPAPGAIPLIALAALWTCQRRKR